MTSELQLFCLRQMKMHNRIQLCGLSEFNMECDIFDQRLAGFIGRTFLIRTHFSEARFDFGRDE